RRGARCRKRACMPRGCGRDAATAGRVSGHGRPSTAAQAPHGRAGNQAAGRPKVMRVDAKDMGADLKQVLITKEEIDAKLAELAEKIEAEYTGKDLLIVGVLKGAVMVMADLARALTTPLTMDWMAVSSYGAGTQSSGVVRIMKDLDTDIKGRHVLVV